MAGWLSLMLVVAVAGREATRELQVFELMLLRSVIGLFLLYPLVHANGGFASIRTTRLREHGLRNAVHYSAQFGWFFALTLIPMAHVVAIEFTMPLWTALLAAAFLGERFTAWKGLAVALGLVGVLMIVRPNAGGISTGEAIAFAAAIGFAVSVTMTKSLTRTESPVTIIFWMLVLQSVLGLVPALSVWQWPSAAVWPWVLLVAFGGTFSHYCMARALRHADATVVVPLDFLRVPLTAAAGWWFYSERFDLLTALGAGLILAGNLVNLMRQRAARTSP
ncbi:multidrug DMT transporter permease [Piscinibacter gummiphilus]|uniref:Multidrug DMT transporter permease n=2 Tax=Piscinibacter gummiphilus TaxID=946333 RepID=A0A1W6L5T4_9BURK|nr:multidrug DMT transporter permease [Piscinibacter gummiphilus]ATU64324.1 EamA/RhaT family transporter [Piscinibacter gummiphilus]GLS95286.1 DMT transporter permease [Piscinibacter gummiphilus]